MKPTTDQVSGTLDRIALVLATWFLGYADKRGWITSADVAFLTPTITSFIGLIGASWGYYINRPMAIVQSAAALPGTTVVTSPELAKATPDQKNIVSNAQNQTVKAEKGEAVKP